ncbi:hypothetical protein [Butyrivibrio sp. MC2013]|uniref:hypothetical protein n=1 Tax=Butyrivibrio sp. MC2013 TaxID=1280686 RepID=UPI000405C9AF|nr:hypothetical protein [Butyrivibrio sp. MC2013]
MARMEDEEVVKTKTRKKTKKTRELLDEADRQMDNLRKQREDYEDVLQDLMKQNDALGIKAAKNLRVSHVKFGEGRVVSEQGKYIDVKFGNVIKKFVLPGAIADKHLKVNDDETFKYYVQSNDIHNKILKVQMQIRSTDFAIERQEDVIEKLNMKA